MEPSDLDILQVLMTHESAVDRAQNFSERVVVRRETIAELRALFNRTVE